MKQMFPTRLENKSDATSRAVKDILEKETALRIAKTERLRVARLAREAAAPPVVELPKKPARKTKRALPPKDAAPKDATPKDATTDAAADA